MKPSKQEIDRIKNDFINETNETISQIESLYAAFADMIEEITPLTTIFNPKIIYDYNLTKNERYNLVSELQKIMNNIWNLISFTQREDGEVVSQLHRKAGQKHIVIKLIIKSIILSKSWMNYIYIYNLLKRNIIFHSGFQL